MGVRLLGDPHGSNSHGTCSNISHAYMRAFKTEAPHIGHCRNSPKYGPCYQRRELRLAERSVWAHMEVNICGNVKQPAETLNPSASKLGQHQKGRTHIHHASTKQLLSGRVLRTARWRPSIEFGASGRLQEPVRIVVPVRTYSHNRCLLMPLVLSVGWTWRGVVWCGVAYAGWDNRHFLPSQPSGLLPLHCAGPAAVVPWPTYRRVGKPATARSSRRCEPAAQLLQMWANVGTFVRLLEGSLPVSVSQCACVRLRVLAMG